MVPREDSTSLKAWILPRSASSFLLHVNYEAIKHVGHPEIAYSLVKYPCPKYSDRSVLKIQDSIFVHKDGEELLGHCEALRFKHDNQHTLFTCTDIEP